jgi:hypothetical protein
MKKLLALMAMTAAAGWAGTARAAGVERHFALIVGYNGAPADSADGAVQSLRYADDDALAFYRLENEVGADAIVLTIPDSDTRRRYPQAAESVRPPTKTELLAAIADLNVRMEQAARAGDTPSLLFFYSGHGARTHADGSDDVGLTLADGILSRTELHEQVLARLRAAVVHLVIDACYADALVRPRDLDAQTVAVDPAELAKQLSGSMAALHPNVGVVAAGPSDAPAHEWDLYQAGVFSHEVISGLRGAADVNGDGRVEYSELAAFLASANGEVIDPRARVRGVIHPPATQVRAALIDLKPTPNPKPAWLVGIPASAGRLYVEDERGNRIVDAHAEVGFAMSFAVPAGEPLFVRNDNREADLLLRPGERMPFELLALHARPIRSRGAIESSLRAGLFVRPYGPSYYSGYVDRADIVPVAHLASGLAPPAVLAAPAAREEPRAPGVLKWSLRGAGVALATSSGVFAVLAWKARQDFQGTSVERQAADASDRFRLDTTLSISFMASAVACTAASYLIQWRR